MVTLVLQIIAKFFNEIFKNDVGFYFYATLITIITLIISYPAAYFIRSSKFQNIWLLILIIPTWINLLLKTYAFIGILSHEGMINKMLGIMHIDPLNLLFTSGAFYLLQVIFIYHL